MKKKLLGLLVAATMMSGFMLGTDMSAASATDNVVVEMQNGGAIVNDVGFIGRPCNVTIYHSIDTSGHAFAQFKRNFGSGTQCYSAPSAGGYDYIWAIQLVYRFCPSRSNVTGCSANYSSVGWMDDNINDYNYYATPETASSQGSSQYVQIIGTNVVRVARSGAMTVAFTGVCTNAYNCTM